MASPPTAPAPYRETHQPMAHNPISTGFATMSGRGHSTRSSLPEMSPSEKLAMATRNNYVDQPAPALGPPKPARRSRSITSADSAEVNFSLNHILKRFW